MVEAVVGVALHAIVASVVLGGGLALLVVIATRTLGLTAATRHLLWTTALIATAVMPLAGIGVSLRGASPQPARLAAAPIGPLTRQAVAARALSPAARRPVPGAAVGAAAAPSPGERRAFTTWAPRLSHAAALGVVAAWALGALIGLSSLLVGVMRVRALRRRSSPLDAGLADELPWLTAVGPGREIYLRLSYETETPVAIGFRRPVILIPTELASGDGLAAIEPLVLHEHAHLRRYDDWTNLVQRVIERVFWFNPVVWLIGKRIELEREIASDDAVVAKTGQAKAYASSLWQLAREMRMPEHAVVAPGALLTRKQISVRIEQLLDAKRAELRNSPALVSGIATAAVAAVLLVATSSPAVELPAAAPATTTATATRPTVPVHIVRAQVVQRQRIIAPAMPTLPPTPPAPPALPATAAKPGQRVIIKLHEGATPDEIGRTIGTAVAAIARDLATETPHRASSRARLRGTKLSRELIASCEGCSLQRGDLRGLDLHGLILNGDDLAQADLRGANLRGAKLIGVVLSGANLADADLRDAEINGTELHGANLDGALLTGTKLIGISLRGVSLRGTAMRSVLANCTGCDLVRLDLHGQDLHGIALSGADLSHADLRDANLAGVRFSGVDLSHANLAGADLTNAHLDGCDLSGTDLRRARTSGLQLDGSGLE